MENLEPRATGRGWLKHDLIHRSINPT